MIRQAREMVASGELGEIRVVQAEYPQDWLTTVVEQEADASAAHVTGAMIDYIQPGDSAAVIARLADPAIRIVSLTITEGGYYIDPATPPEWVPYMQAGILEWNEAFELAGFKDAIQVRVAPTEAEDSTFSLLDARYSVLRWVASPTRSANSGGDVVDPRSGEVLAFTGKELHVLSATEGQDVRMLVISLTEVRVDGRPATPADIREGGEVRATYELAEGEPVALLVEVQNPPGATPSRAFSGAPNADRSSDSTTAHTARTGWPSATRSSGDKSPKLVCERSGRRRRRPSSMIEPPPALIAPPA